MVIPHQLVGSGVHSPASPIALLLAFCSGVPSGSLLQVSRQVFAMGSPFRVESVSVLDRNEVSSTTFLVFGWSLRDGVTLSGRGCRRSRSERRLFLLTFPSGWCLAFAMGPPILGRVALFCAFDRNEGFFHSSILSCFAMGSPCGSGVLFSHTRS